MWMFRSCRPSLLWTNCWWGCFWGCFMVFWVSLGRFKGILRLFLLRVLEGRILYGEDIWVGVVDPHWFRQVVNEGVFRFFYFFFFFLRVEGIWRVLLLGRRNSNSEHVWESLTDPDWFRQVVDEGAFKVFWGCYWVILRCFEGVFDEGAWREDPNAKHLWASLTDPHRLGQVVEGVFRVFSGF